MNFLYSQYSNAHQDDLFQVMTETIPPVSGNILPQGATMKSVMDTWTLQTGFPVVSAQRTQGSSIVILTQVVFSEFDQINFACIFLIFDS